jgi:hypothetical protein
VIIRFSEELDAAGLRQGVKSADNFRGKELELLE